MYKASQYIFFVFIFLCTQKIISNDTTTLQVQEHWITVFVHGIKSIKPFLNTQNFFLFFTDKVKNTPYARAVNIARQDSFFYKNQAMQGLGLKKIDTNLIKNNASGAIAAIYDSVTHEVNPDEINYFYTYGWSGLLSPSARYQDAEGLLLGLQQELQVFWDQGIFPKVRLIGYSHGANVCLNVAAIRQDKYPLIPITVDELILLGGPIQSDTDYLVNDQIFKKVYNFYSEKDRIQPIDFFSFQRLFSRKKFESRRSFKISKKVRQISIKVTRTRKSSSCCKEQLISATSNICVPGVARGKHCFLRDMSPGHIELWFFEWSPRHYRENFALAPLPVLAYIPYILHQVKNIEESLSNPHRIIVDIRPEHEQLIIRQKKGKYCLFEFPFLICTQQKQLAEIADKVRPDKYSEDEYNQHLYNAIEQANKEFCEIEDEHVKEQTIKQEKCEYARKRTSHEPCI